jgi:hypothetical protein
MDEDVVAMMAGNVPEHVRRAMQVFGCPETMALTICIMQHEVISNVKLMEIFEVDQKYLWEVIKPLGAVGMIEQTQWEDRILYRMTRFGNDLYTRLFDAVMPDFRKWEPIKP